MQQRVESISIEKWRCLASSGIAPSVRIKVHGNSMLPLIRSGRDIITIVPLQNPVYKGDVVLFKAADSRYVVHRIWKLKETQVQTLGDFCESPDAWIEQESICGIVLKIERGKHHLVLNNKLWKLFGLLWLWLFPLRKLYWRVRHSIQKILQGDTHEI